MKTNLGTRREAAVGAIMGAIVAAVFFTVTAASADGLPGTEHVPRIVPFEGELALDGQPYSGSVDLRVSLYDAQGASAAVWSETQTGVAVAGGRFAVLLGATGQASSTSLMAAVADGSRLYVGVSVKAAGAPSSAWVALAGRQLLGPSPYALWTPQATDMDVARDLRVDGATDAPSLTVGAGVAVDRASAQLAIGAGATGVRGLALADPDAGEGAQIVYRPADHEVAVEGRWDLTPGVAAVAVDTASGDATVRGSASFGGDVTAAGDLRLPAGATVDVQGAGTLSLAPGVGGRKGIIFSEGAAGVKLVYDEAAQTLVVEQGASTTQDGAGIVTFDGANARITFHGNLYTGRQIFTPKSTWSSASTWENDADKSYQADSDCVVGATRVTTVTGGSDCDSGSPNAGICMCVSGTGKSKGWFCLH